MHSWEALIHVCHTLSPLILEHMDTSLLITHPCISTVLSLAWPNGTVMGSLNRGFPEKSSVCRGMENPWEARKAPGGLPGLLCWDHPCLYSTAGTSGHRTVINYISQCFAHTVKLAMLKTRGSFPGEELNLSPAGPGLLSLAWWGWQS